MYFSLRFTGFIGGGGNIDYILNKAKNNEDIVLYSKGDIFRDYITFEYGNKIIIKLLACFEIRLKIRLSCRSNPENESTRIKATSTSLIFSKVLLTA